jgi:hypothetical protein
MTDYTFVRIYDEYTNGLVITARLYEGDINISGSGGGWTAVQRPQRDPLTAWRGGTDSYTMEIPLLFDTLTSGGNVEGQCRTLEKMAGVLTSAFVQPPILIVNAHGALANDYVNFPALRWIIPEPPVWGEQLRGMDGKRVRQVVTVKLMHYTAYDKLSRDKTHTAPSNRTVKAKTGDTYNKIAARELKAYGGIRWGNRLAQLNGSRDGAAKPLAGREVKLPTVAQIKLWERTPRR